MAIVFSVELPVAGLEGTLLGAACGKCEVQIYL